jgi:hypothetical protein
MSGSVPFRSLEGPLWTAHIAEQALGFEARTARNAGGVCRMRR